VRRRATDSITNVQTQGVDEGGIVKQAGEHLVILRRGRLFTVRVGGDDLRPVAMLDAYAPGSDPRGAWYDELLVSGSTVVVVGYSYARGGTEIGLFELGRDGALSYRATYHLRSFDYYSSRNYASRLVDGKLVFYTPTLLQPWGPAPSTCSRPCGAGVVWTAMCPRPFERILPATRVFRTDDDFDPAMPLALHTVTQCELGAASLRCEATPCSARPAACSMCRPVRSMCGPRACRAGRRGRGRQASGPSRPCSACRWTVPRPAPSRLRVCRWTRCRSWKMARAT
jgi:hypothetical protein